jgi:hypothetical protein
MKKLKFTFKNAAGEELAGLLELPENPKAFALLGVSLDIENYSAEIRLVSRVS